MRKTAFVLVLASITFVPSYVWAAETALPETPSSQSVFIISDLDRSGSIDLGEFTSYIEQAESKNYQQASTDFGRMDVNHDSKLSLDELEDGEDTAPVASR